ncbi:hypothetical protein [Aquimarina mytili]|uniref:DUF1330 domain-containing protein n=1 Tax=Aquimarina mytili TaxID=874423 RepID=A0A937D6K0_9FLAO|nr:hypothetical protein [Aquimarina mytili]MBL0684504.1 hypothetical protein [Aquimarina mytili]
MKFLKISILACLTLAFSTTLNAQSNIKSYDFKKGEILDILLLTTKPEGNALFKKYRETAFPVAIKRSYKPLPGFKITETTQGNIQPTSFLFGKWNDLQNREAFIAEIETFVPDFHKQRRDIWSIFNLVYYEMPQDTSFKINKDKFIVATAYWKKNSKAFQEFKKGWMQKAKSKGGKSVLELTNGKSPVGYYYNPDYMVITQWENKAAFEVFYNENLKMNHKAVQHVNQFVIN